MPVPDVSVGPPWRVRFRAPRSAEDVLVCVDADRSVTVIAVDGSEDLLPGAALLAALGAEPPAWVPYAEMVDRALAGAPGLSAVDALAYLVMPVARRKALAGRLGTFPSEGLTGLTVGQAWLFAFDPERRVRNLLAEHFPHRDELVPVAVAMLDDVERTRNKVLSVVDWSPVLDRAAVTHRDPEVRAAFIRRHGKRVPGDLVEALLSDPDRTVRDMVAAYARLTPPLIAALARDEDAHVRGKVISRVTLSESLVVQLAHDESDQVRRAVAQFQRVDLRFGAGDGREGCRVSGAAVGERGDSFGCSGGVGGGVGSG